MEIGKFYHFYDTIHYVAKLIEIGEHTYIGNPWKCVSSGNIYNCDGGWSKKKS